MNKWKTKFSYWKFDKKILLLVTVSILIVTLTVAGVSLTFSIASMKEQSVELLQMQNNTEKLLVEMRDIVRDQWIHIKKSYWVRSWMILCRITAGRCRKMS